VSIVLALKIQNETTLPDGGPLGITIDGTRGIDIGRDQHLDWTLPDPSRFISGRHCEIRWHDNAYWLHDVSTNGTFLDGDDRRLKAPHKLRDGDRFSIGHYIILANVSGTAAQAHSTEASTVGASAAYNNLWDPVGDVAPPIDPRRLKAARDLQPVKPDFLDWAIDLPSSAQDPTAVRADTLTRESVRADDSADAWTKGLARAAAPVPVGEPPPAPTPRRPLWVTGEPEGPWAAPTTPSQTTSHVQQDDRGGGKSADGGNARTVLGLIAQGAGLSSDAFAMRDPAEFAQELGVLIRLMLENTRALLEGRLQAKRFARSSNQTSVQALDNNPLKFAPTVDEAMRIMFGPPTRSYLDARNAVTRSFDDLKSHQIKTFSAMQHALKRLLQEFDPELIAQEAAPSGRLAGVLGSAKAKAWDVYAARWQAHTHSDEDGMLNAYMRYFAEYYDRDDNAN
jgi:type VI secretion system protein ImpI